MASTPSYINPTSGARGTLTLTASLQEITSGAAGGSFLVRAFLVNSAATARIITISDGSDNTMSVFTLNISAGNSANVKSLDILATGSLPGENDAYGNKVFRLRPYSSIKIKCDSVSGGAPILHWERIDF